MPKNQQDLANSNIVKLNENIENDDESQKIILSVVLADIGSSLTTRQINSANATEETPPSN